MKHDRSHDNSLMSQAIDDMYKLVGNVMESEAAPMLKYTTLVYSLMDLFSHVMLVIEGSEGKLREEFIKEMSDDFEKYEIGIYDKKILL